MILFSKNNLLRYHSIEVKEESSDFFYSYWSKNTYPPPLHFLYSAHVQKNFFATINYILRTQYMIKV